MEQSHHLEFPVVKPEEGPEADIVTAGFQCPMRGVKPPEIIAFERPGRVEQGVLSRMICFLENLVSPDADFVQASTLMRSMLAGEQSPEEKAVKVEEWTVTVSFCFVGREM